LECNVRIAQRPPNSAAARCASTRCWTSEEINTPVTSDVINSRGEPTNHGPTARPHAAGESSAMPAIRAACRSSTGSIFRVCAPAPRTTIRPRPRQSDKTRSALSAATSADTAGGAVGTAAAVTRSSPAVAAR